MGQQPFRLAWQRSYMVTLKSKILLIMTAISTTQSLQNKRSRNHAHSLAFWEASMGSVTNYFMCHLQLRVEIVIVKILSKRAGHCDQLW